MRDGILIPKLQGIIQKPKKIVMPPVLMKGAAEGVSSKVGKPIVQDEVIPGSQKELVRQSILIGNSG